MASVQPSDEQLQQAFAAARKAHWPQSLDEALADPLYGRLVRMNATQLASGHNPFASRVNHRPVVVAPEAPHPAEAPARRPPKPARRRQPEHTELPLQLPFVDRKRAAAGDDE